MLELETRKRAAISDMTLAPNRRGFLKSLGGGLLVLFSVDGTEAQESGRARHDRRAEPLPARPAEGADRMSLPLRPASLDGP